MELVSKKELAKELGVAPSTIETWRRNGIGPCHVKIGAKVRYPRHEIESWLKTLKVQKPARKAKTADKPTE